MRNIKEVSKLVKKILMEEPKARDSFCDLYYRVCLAKNTKALGMPFAQVLMNLRELNLPPFESVRRAKQKVQAAHPELRSTPEVEEQMILNEEIVRDYAKQVKV